MLLLSQDGFENDSPKTKFQTIASLSQFDKVTVQRSTVVLWTVISNQMVKYQLPDTQLDQISDH